MRIITPVLILTFIFLLTACDKDAKGKSNFAGAWECDRYIRTVSADTFGSDTIINDCGKLLLHFDEGSRPEAVLDLSVIPFVMKDWNINYLYWVTEEDSKDFIYFFIDDPNNPSSIFDRTRATVTKVNKRKLNLRFYYTDLDQNLLYSEAFEFSKP